MAKRRVLVTGATGFVGGRLARRLRERDDLILRGLTRHPDRPGPKLAGMEVAGGDVRDAAAMARALDGVDAAYYLVHSMEAGVRDFAEADREAAHTFARAAADAGVEQVIYLGGLGGRGERVAETADGEVGASGAGGASKHLASREEVGRILMDTLGERATVLRAAVVLGAGSASFRLIEDLVGRLPVMVCPKWVRSKCQPISVQDVVWYLDAVLFDPRARGQAFDVGGPEILSYRDMMQRYAALTHRRRLLVPVPVLTPWLSSLWLGLVTDVPVALARPLIEGVSANAVARDARIRALYPRRLQSFEEAVLAALAEEGRAPVPGGRPLPG